MATIKPTVTIVSNASNATTPGPSTTALNLSATGNFTATNAEVQVWAPTQVHSACLINASAVYGETFMYVKNTSSVDIHLCKDDAGTTANIHMTLSAGEFAFFPWAGRTDLFAEAASGTTNSLEVWIFKQT